jgi:hypothetical protein
MSEIPFVRRLGDALESAAATRLATRRRRIRRRLGIGALGLAIAATGVAAASGILTGTPEQLAVNSVGCYDAPSLNANTAILSTGTDTPVETCARILGTDGPLSACAGEGAVLVFPGRGVCRRLGLARLPPEYHSARARFNALHRDVVALERSADCIPPDELARRAQALLDRGGWTGWRAVVRDDIDQGPCGSISALGGDGRRYFEGALDPDGRELFVVPGVSRSLENLLYSAEQNLGGRLMDASGERCYDRAGLDAMVRERLAPTGRRLELYAAEPLIEGASISGPRGRRLNEGCAIIVEVGPAADGESIRVGVLY